MPCLRWIGATGRGRLFPIYKAATTLGSAGGNDVTLDAPGVAAYHAQIVFDGRDFSLDEVDPVAEIQINGRRKRRVRLAHNDHVHLGEAELVFSLLEEAEAPGQRSEAEAPVSELTGLRKLFQFSEKLLVTREVQQLLEALLDGAIEATGADKGFVVLLRGSQTEIRAARNLRQETLPDSVRQLSDTVLAKVVESRRPLIVHNAIHDTMFKRGIRTPTGCPRQAPSHSMLTADRTPRSTK